MATTYHLDAKIPNIDEPQGHTFARVNIRIPGPDDAPNGVDGSFGFTCDEYRSAQGRAMHADRSWVQSGPNAERIALVDETLGAYARLLHLCKLDGTPMHAVANAWYRLSEQDPGTSYHGAYAKLTNHERAAGSLHIEPAALPPLGEFVADALANRSPDDDRPTRDVVREYFEHWVKDNLADLWRARADEFVRRMAPGGDLLAKFPEYTHLPALDR